MHELGEAAVVAMAADVGFVCRSRPGVLIGVELGASAVPAGRRASMESCDLARLVVPAGITLADVHC